MGGLLTVAASSWREPPPASKMVEVRCKNCRRLLFSADAVGRAVIVCKRCKVSQEVRLTTRPER